MTTSTSHHPLLLLCATALAALLCCSTPALAARGHEFAGVFGEHGTGTGQLGEPVAVAIDEATGATYVVDRSGDRVEMFDGAPKAIDGLIGTKLAAGEFDGSGTHGEGATAGSGGQADEEPTGRFDEPEAIAVDNACYDHKPALTGTACETYDPSNGDVYVLDTAHEVVDKFTATGKYVGQITAKTLSATLFARGLRGVAVEGDGDVVVGTNTSVELAGTEEGVFRLSDAVVNVVLPRSGNPTGFAPVSRVPGFVFPGLGVAGGRVFVVQAAIGAPFVSVWGLGGELLSGGVFSGLVGGLVGEVCSGDVYVDEGPVGGGVRLLRLSGSGGLVEDLGVPGGGGAGVGVDCVGSGGSVFVAEPGAGVVGVFGPEGPKPPEVVTGSGVVSNVTSSSAGLAAEVNPRSEPGEAATEYLLEYGLCASAGACSGTEYEHKERGTISARFEPVPVDLPLTGLTPAGQYHFRVGARNAQSPRTANDPGGVFVYGEEKLFVTQAALPAGLLDDRAWELVSPVDKQGAELLPISEGAVVQAAAGGGAVTFMASSATEANPAGNASKTQLLARRGPAGWESCDVGLPVAEASGAPVGESQEYTAFSPDLSTGLVRPFGPVVPGFVAGEREVSPLLAGLAGSCKAPPAYRALLSSCPEAGECERAVEEHADLPAGTKVAVESECRVLGDPFCDAEPQGANTDLSAVVLSSRTSLVEGAPERALYEWAGGQVLPVSVRPSGSIIGGVAHSPGLGTQAGNAGSSLRGAVSNDGSRVVWSEDASEGHLYVWDRAFPERSVQLDTVKGGTGGGSVGPIYQFMTGDGSRVFFTDTQQLTAGAGAKNNAPDLYECVLVEEESGLKCDLRDLTPAVGGVGGEAAHVQGQVLGGSEDGGLVYFVANGELTKSPSISGEVPVKGNCGETGGLEVGTECNLFVWDEVSGETALVGVLSGLDSADWGNENGVQAHLTGRVTGNGERLVFMSQRPLTGYDNRDAVNAGVRDEEVFEYHLGGGLVCVSCNPSGERPHGLEAKKVNDGVAGGHDVLPGGVWLAGLVPGWTPFRLNKAGYQSRYFDESGRVFFDSTDGLATGDNNGVMDVYEYEPVGVGSCQEGATGYVSVEGGCVGLVSSGQSDEESGFLDASESGNDVFFLTSAKLSKRDTDTSYDVYDARVGGEPESQAPQPVECAGDACQTPVAPPEDLTPGSLTSQGQGNPLYSVAPGPALAVKKAKPETRAQRLKKALVVCRRERGKSRRKNCEKTARRHYAPVKQRKRT